MKTVFAGMVMVIVFSGCSAMAQKAGNDYIKQHGLEHKVSSACYDLVDKKDCPSGWMQYDINILPFIPISSRFCFGLNEINKPFYPVGMVCYSYDFVKDD